MKQLSAKLSNDLNDSYTSVLKKYSAELSKEIDSFLDNFENSVKIASNKEGSEIGIGFNVKASFVGGLAGLVTYGALSLWAASLGNLGAYILVAKGVGILAAIGIHVGGAAAAAAAIAAIGGPVVIAIGLAAIIASLVYAMFSSGWKKTIAQKIVTGYDEKNVLRQYLSSNSKYWSDTEDAFNHASNQLEKEFEDYITELKKDVESNDEEIKSKITFGEEKKKIYDSLITSL